MPAVINLLTEGRALLTPPENRTRLATARDKKGEKCSPYDPKAACFCSVGAIHKVGGRETTILTKYEVTAYLTKAVHSVSKSHTSIIDFNDDPKVSHEQLLAVWDKALELAHASVA